MFPGTNFDPTVKPEWGAQLDYSHPLAQGLLNAWLLNEVGDRVVSDLCALRNGTLNSGVAWQATLTGSALAMDGTSGLVNVGNSSAWNFGSNDFALSVWINPTSLSSSTRYQLCSKDSNVAGGRQWTFEINVESTAGSVGFAIFPSDALFYGRRSPAGSLNAGKWQHVLVQRKGSAQEIYINGVSQSLTAYASSQASIGTMQSATTNLYLGGRVYSGFNEYFLGSMNLPMIYNRALTPSEVAELYAAPYQMLLPSSVHRFYQALSGTAWSKTLSEGMTLSDARKLGGGKSVGETLALTDVRLALFSKALADALTLSDTTARGAGKRLSDPFSLTDTRSLAATRKLLEALSLSDAGVSAILNAGGQAWSRLLSETFAVADVLGKGGAKGLVESLSFTDARLLSLGKTVQESLALTDSRALGILHRLAETLGVSDTVNAFIGTFALYFFVQISQSGYKADYSPSSDTTLGGHA